MPSQNEGLPLALVEAMASGCCPIATAVGGIPEVLTSPELGWLIGANDPRALTAAMADAASRGRDQLAVMGQRGREHVLTHFNAGLQFAMLGDIIAGKLRGHVL